MFALTLSKLWTVLILWCLYIMFKCYVQLMWYSLNNIFVIFIIYSQAKTALHYGCHNVSRNYEFLKSTFCELLIFVEKCWQHQVSNCFLSASSKSFCHIVLQCELCILLILLPCMLCIQTDVFTCLIIYGLNSDFYEHINLIHRHCIMQASSVINFCYPEWLCNV